MQDFPTKTPSEEIPTQAYNFRKLFGYLLENLRKLSLTKISTHQEITIWFPPWRGPRLDRKGQNNYLNKVRTSYLTEKWKGESLQCPYTFFL